MWYEQFSRKEILKHIERDFGNSQDGIFEEHKRSSRLTFDPPRNGPGMPMSRGRRTQITIKPKIRKLQPDEQLDRIKDQVIGEDGQAPANTSEPLNSSLTGPKLKHSVSERTVLALHLPLRKLQPGASASPSGGPDPD